MRVWRSRRLEAALRHGPFTVVLTVDRGGDGGPAPLPGYHSRSPPMTWRWVAFDSARHQDDDVKVLMCRAQAELPAAR